MSWRNWLVRLLVFSIVGACVAGFLLYQRWTDPVAVRELAVAKLQQMFPGTTVALDSARLRLFGGIQVSELRFCRKDDPNQVEIINIPSAVIYHDKEKLIEGEMAIRKVELHRPRFRVIRGIDGAWNVDGIVAPPRPDVPWPTLVIQQGTVVFEDRLQDARVPAIDIGNVNLTFINDPLPLVRFDGAAQSSWIGALNLKGSFQRLTKEFVLNVKSTQMKLREEFLQRVKSTCPDGKLDDLRFEAEGDVEADLHWKPEAARGLTYDVRLKLHGGKVSHPKLPMPLEDLVATLQLNNQLLRLQQATARSGETTVQAQAVGLLPCIDETFELEMVLKRVPVTANLVKCLPEKVQHLRDLYQAEGPTGVHLTLARRHGEWADCSDGSPSRIRLLPDGAKICFRKFDYPVDDVRGRLDYFPVSKLVQIDLIGQASRKAVSIKGHWKGQGAEAEGRLDLETSNVPIDSTLIDALPEKFQKLARSFHPKGLIDIKAVFRAILGQEEVPWAFHCRVHDAKVLWDEFPYPFDSVSGQLDIYPDAWEFREFQGRRNGAWVRVNGKSLPPEKGPDGDKDEGMYIEIVGKDLGLDEDLHSAMKGLKSAPHMAKTWDNFLPKGKMNFGANIERRRNRAEDLDIRVEVAGCSIQPVFFPYLLHDLGGVFRYHRGKLEFANLQAKHRNTKVELGYGAVEVLEGGGYSADFPELKLWALRFDDEFVDAIPVGLRKPIENLRCKDPVHLKTWLVIRQSGEPGSVPDIYWDGQAWFQDARLTTGIDWSDITGTIACRGRHNGRSLVGLAGNFLLHKATAFKQPFHDVVGQFKIEDSAPEILHLGIKAPIFDGDISGQVRLEINSALRYEINLTASQISLQEFGKHNIGPDGQLNGIAVARLFLTGQGNNVQALEGHGSVDVPNGQLYNLPLLLDLIKFLGLRIPDRTAFEEMHAQYKIHGERVHLKRVDLFGNAISMSGKGEFNLDGTDLQIDLYPTPARINSLLPNSVKPWPIAFSKKLFAVELRGKFGGGPDDLKFHKRLMPGITEPLIQMRERVNGLPPGLYRSPGDP